MKRRRRRCHVLLRGLTPPWRRPLKNKGMTPLQQTAPIACQKGKSRFTLHQRLTMTAAVDSAVAAMTDAALARRGHESAAVACENRHPAVSYQYTAERTTQGKRQSVHSLFAMTDNCRPWLQRTKITAAVLPRTSAATTTTTTTITHALFLPNAYLPSHSY